MKRKKGTNRYLFLIVLLILLSCKRTVKEYFPESNVLWIEKQISWITFKNHGEYHEYNPEGILVVNAFYKNGFLDGDLKVYFDDGKLNYHVVYNKGTLHNIIQYLTKDGDKIEYGSFKDGNGMLKLFSENGRLKAMGPMKDGLREGEWSYFVSDSIVYKRVIYIKGLGPDDDEVSDLF